MGFEMEHLYQGIAFALFRTVSGDDDDPGVKIGTRGNVLRLQVTTEADGVIMTVYGEGCRDAGQQLVLACMQRLGVKGLRDLHKVPLRKAAPLKCV